jgi:two-component system, LytTR family, sensor kinase
MITVRKALIQNALISTPILAAYAVAPLYIFDKLSFGDFLVANVGLSINICFVWIINIYIALYHQDASNWRKYAFSYLSNFVFQGIFISLPTFMNIGPRIGNTYVAYPVITSIAFNAIILLLCHSASIAQKKTSAELEVQELKFQNVEAQKKILLQQLHPHFLFNALSVLKSLIKEKPEEAELYSVKLSDFLRYSVKAPTQITVPLEEELEFTSGYIELQKARFENSFTFLVDIPKAAGIMKIPVYALQTLVENAFKHNYFTEKKPLHIRILYKNKTLLVTNNKVSLKITERSGTGLTNLNQRHKIITGEELKIEESEENFSVTLQLLEV